MSYVACVQQPRLRTVRPLVLVQAKASASASASGGTDIVHSDRFIADSMAAAGPCSPSLVVPMNRAAEIIISWRYITHKERDEAAANSITYDEINVLSIVNMRGVGGGKWMEVEGGRKKFSGGG